MKAKLQGFVSGPARHFRQRLLGPSGDETAARDQPPGRRPLPPGPGIQRKANQVVAILGCKTPNIQNLAVGGVANAINLDNPATLNMEKLYTMKDLLDEVVTLRQQVYLPDVCAIGAFYPDGSSYGARRDQLPGGPRPPHRHEGHAVRPSRRHGHGRRPLHATRPSRSSTIPTSRTNVAETIAHAWYNGDWSRSTPRRRTRFPSTPISTPTRSTPG